MNCTRTLAAVPIIQAGEPEWRLVSTIVDVLQSAALIQIGVELNSPGQMSARDCSFTVVDSSVDLTSSPITAIDKLKSYVGGLPLAPINLDFAR